MWAAFNKKFAAIKSEQSRARDEPDGRHAPRRHAGKYQSRAPAERAPRYFLLRVPDGQPKDDGPDAREKRRAQTPDESALRWRDGEPVSEPEACKEEWAGLSVQAVR